MVGLLGLVVVAAAGGGIYYYQFVIPHPTSCGLPTAHRLIFLTAIIQELGGFTVKNTAYLNQSTLPNFSDTLGPDLSGVNFHDYKLADSKNKTITANAGDTITLYIDPISTTDPRQYIGIPGHGFSLSPLPNNIQGPIPSVLHFGNQYTVTFTVTSQGTYTYICTITCSDQHPAMTGAIVVGCGG